MGFSNDRKALCERATRATEAVYKWRPMLTIILIAAALLIPRRALAEGGKEDLEAIERAILEKGLHWSARSYSREFALGLLEGEEKPDLPRALTPRRSLLDDPQPIDWRDHGGDYVPDVRDQGNCGSCWAFASVGTMEAGYAISMTTPGVFIDLAEQHAVSCDSQNMGCSGGNSRYVAQFLRHTGVPDELCFPYAAANLPCDDCCPDWQLRAVRIAEYERVAHSIGALQQALQDGPFQVSFDVYDDFSSYDSGVYEYATGSYHGGHAVLLVGYADTPGQYGGGYFIVKNSWSDGWGEEGFFRIGYSQVTNDIRFGRSAYRYHMTTPPLDDYEPDEGSAQATGLENGIPQQHNICGGGDEDWFSFELFNHLEVTLETSGIEGGDTCMWLYDSDLGQAAYNDDKSGSWYSLIEITLAPGRYYVKVNAYYDTIIISDYTIELTTPPPPLYQSAFLRTQAYGLAPSAGGWSSQDRYPRLSGDVDGDGDDDIVGFGESAVIVALAENGTFQERTVWLQRSLCPATGWYSYDLYPRFLGDLDNDGDDDIVGFGSHKVFVALSNGSGFDPQQVWLEGSFCHVKGWSSQDTYPRQLADANGDGRADIVGFGNRAVYVALANSMGDGFEPQQVWLQHRFSHAGGWSSQRRYPRLLADVDGDGADDIVGFGDRAVSVSRSTETSFGEREIWLWDSFCQRTGWSSQELYPRLLGDINGDGRADIVGFGSHNIIGSQSSGGDFAATEIWLPNDLCSNTGWTNQQLYPRALGDLTANGQVDIAGFGASGVYVSLRNP